MVNVSEELKSAFLNGRQKNLTLRFYKNNQLVDTLESESIVLESMEIEQLLCSEAQLTFGLCNAASFKVDIFNGSVTHKDLIVKPEISALDDENTEHTFNLGVYKVVEDVVSDDRNTRTLTAYDALYDVVNNDYSDWYKNLNMPMTLKQFRNAFFSHIGITQVDIDLPNDNMQIQKTIDTNNLSGSTILKAILELNASFGFINYEGKFVYTLWKEGVGLFPAVDLYPSEDLYPVGVAAAKFGTTEESEVILDSLVYADYTVAEITGVKFQTTSTDEGTVVGSDGNIYQILSNFLLYDKSAADLQTIGNNFLEYADQLYYRPAKFQVRSHPWIELGDFVSVNAKSFRVTMPVLKRTISGITALYDDYEAQGSEKYTAQANNLYQMTENLYRKTLEIIKNTDEVSTRLTKEITDEVTRATQKEESIIRQTSEQISLKVSKGDVSSQLSVESDQVKITGGRLIVESTNFNLDGNGNVSFKGSIKSGSTITGAAISGSTLNTNDGQHYWLDIDDSMIMFMGGSAVEARIYCITDSRKNVLKIESLKDAIILNPYYASRAVYIGSISETNKVAIKGDIPSIPAVPTKTEEISATYSGTKLSIHFKNAKSGSQVGATVGYVDQEVSDERLKENIVDLGDIEDKYMRFRPISFTYKEWVEKGNHGLRHGLVAQEVEEIDEDLIFRLPTFEGTIYEETCGEEYLNLKYEDLHAYHIQMIQKQKMRIDELEQKNSELEERIARLEALIGDK